ncbi:(2Fe-2S)-binding protein [Bosea sp. (in: a-proteobacteria)]|uniref:(2Fe-2S)-binding protein n=1 Tax=Bosea sp. (in: a-proteobacteria) TaxID=1871050 RepID=UPI0027333AF9|nr:(2Fe-2S)-binding protein [Bosea sp. (in: a-proteobacteria)]MDP3408292.1 (2Fe-2S)-binding protein [Bosea sp. (in: a-proteobacteria)]
MSTDGAQFMRVATRRGAAIAVEFDGLPLAATEGDSILAVLLTNGLILRRHEFGSEPRSGFCLMGACQDCWVWSVQGGRLRACTTPVADGMILASQPPAGPHE